MTEKRKVFASHFKSLTPQIISLQTNWWRCEKLTMVTGDIFATVLTRKIIH